MGALPNTLPTTPRKPQSRATKTAKLNQYGRDPGSPSERMRASSDYAKGTGYGPLFHAFIADWGRLSSGHIADMMFMAVLCKSLGRSVKKGEPRETATLPIAVADLAALVNPANPPIRSVERELERWKREKIAIVLPEGKGMVSVELLYRGWESLADFKSDIVEMPASDETIEPEQVDESKPGNQRVTGKKAVRLPAGALSKAFPVSCGVRTFRYRADGPVDLDITAVIQAGELVVTSRLPDGWQEKAGFGKPSSNVSNDLISPPRHGRRGEQAKVDHPRAAELIGIFDPLLGRSGAVLLAMDAPSLRAACEAIADCDHHDLLKFVMNRADRGPIRKPQTVAVICAEALASSRAGKIINGTRLGGKKGICRFCGAPSERSSKLTGRCSICDGDKSKASRILRDGGLSDAEIAEIQK